MGTCEPLTEVDLRRPAPALRPYVDRYVGYRLVGFPPGIHRGLPSRYVTFIVSFDAGVELVAMPGTTQAPGRFGAFVSGLHAGPATIRHDGTQCGIAIDLTPLGCRAILGVPAAELSAIVVELDDVVGPVAHELRERVALADTWDQRFAAVDRVLSRNVRTGARAHPGVGRAWDRLVGTGGLLEIGELAAEVGWSRRQLGERFRREVGVAPKVAARIVRFERATTMLRRAERPTLASVAADCGFYDQPHMVREWHDLAGCSPSTWMEDEALPSV